MQSLLEMLNREDSLVRRIRRREENIRFYEQRMETIKEIYIECESKYKDLNEYHGLIEKERTSIASDKLELDETRDQLLEHIRALFKPLNSKET